MTISLISLTDKQMCLIIVSCIPWEGEISEVCIYSSKGQKAHDFTLENRKVRPLIEHLLLPGRHSKSGRLGRESPVSLKKISFYPGPGVQTVKWLEVTAFIWTLVWFCAGYLTQNIYKISYSRIFKFPKKSTFAFNTHFICRLFTITKQKQATLGRKDGWRREEGIWGLPDQERQGKSQKKKMVQKI